MKASEAMWTLDDSTIVLTLVKGVQTWYRYVVKGHPEIDATKVDSTRHVTEYDDETQAAIRKIMVWQIGGCWNLLIQPSSRVMCVVGCSLTIGKRRMASRRRQKWRCKPSWRQPSVLRGLRLRSVSCVMFSKSTAALFNTEAKR